MVSKNDITGDPIKSRILSADGRNNHDRIFAKRTFNDWLLIEGLKIAIAKDDEKISYSEFKKRIALYE